MRRSISVLLTASVLVASLSSWGVAAEAKWTLVGTWKITVQGQNCAPAQIVRISAASASVVDGTTNVDDGYGTIVGGSFDGVNATFTNKFIWDGRRQTEKWKATLSRNGNYIKGSYKNTDPKIAGCRFSGPRAR